jgi:hypothetical protein
MAIQIPQFVSGLAATTLNASTANAGPVDMNVAGCDGAVFHVVLGTQTTGQFTAVKLQESDDNSNWVDVTNGALFSTATLALTSADNGTSIVMGCKRTGRRRYIRLQLTANSTANLPITYVAAAGLNATANDPITPALRSLFVS